MVNKWSENDIKILLEYYEKKGPSAISEELNRSPRTISNKAKRMGLIFNSSSFYESDNFDSIVKLSNNIVDVCRNLNLKLTGGNRNTVKKWIRVKNLDTSHFCIIRTSPKSIKFEMCEILVENSTYIHTSNLKDRLYKDGIKFRICEMCGQGENWNGKKMSLILDHINGDKYNNRIENLRIVCPNCNATLETNGGRNIKNKLKQTTLN